MRWLMAACGALLIGGCTAPTSNTAGAGSPVLGASPPSFVMPVASPTFAPVAPAPDAQPIILSAAPLADAIVLPTVTPEPVEVTAAAPPVEPYRFSPLYDNLAAAYPAQLVTGRFVLHYTPGTLPAQNPQAVADLVMAALLHHEQLLGIALPGSFDIYAAGSLFAAPDQALRGRSFSVDRRTFFLSDGSGSSADRAYIAAHELAHVVTWNALGAPSSVMLSEGAAVYAGMHFVADQDLLPLQDFCVAYWQAGSLPHVTADLDYLGHIRNLENYYSAGCFVQFLIEHYGAAAFGQIYASGDYFSAYGKGLVGLEAEWLAYLAQQPASLAYAPGELVEATTRVERAYDDLFAAFDGSPAQLEAYYALDGARTALLMGRLDEVQAFWGQ